MAAGSPHFFESYFNYFNSSYPYHGSLDDRASITKQLNIKLKELCAKYSFCFLDIHSLYANSEGILDDERSDKVVHVNPSHNDLIKQSLLDYLNQTFKLFPGKQWKKSLLHL